ncbi:kinase-like domain-containing protein [Mycena rosella]|uniref:Kinase-like domain-containing protein n=1 Tax=Mycena rosella TaxID=1033263 RepID=A0AAD7BGC7_MYCRO|nr:kinase-like domain-containing protein [Mycena rosella]
MLAAAPGAYNATAFLPPTSLLLPLPHTSMLDAAEIPSVPNSLADASAVPAAPTGDLDYTAVIAEIPSPRDLDLTGAVEKVDAFCFESGAVADISLGTTVNSERIKDQMVAIKIFRRIHIDRNMLEATIRTYIDVTKELYEEAKGWSRLEHPNILAFLGISLDLGPSPALVTPFYRSGSIMGYLKDGSESPQERLVLVSGIAQGIAYLHAEGVVHGNLTTKKVLINNIGLPVICGYGLANVSGQLSKSAMISPSARFTAPEYFINESTQGQPSLRTMTGDVYSLSMVILEIMTGVRPFHELPSDTACGGFKAAVESPACFAARYEQSAARLQSLRRDVHSQTGSEEPDGSGTEAGPSTFDSSVDESDGEEEHPCLAEINSENLKGRLFRTDEFPYSAGGNSNIYRGQLIHKNGYKVQRETRIWSQLNHRNLLPFLGVWDEPIAAWPALISPFYKSGDLRQYLRNCPTVDKEKMILGVASGLEYLHRYDIVHGDLKVHNVLVDKHGTPCICDFGISKIINSKGFTTSSVGTAPYMAPELFLVWEEIVDETFPRASTNKSSDIYSFGLLVLEIVTTALRHRPTQPVLTAEAHGSLRPKRSDYDSGLVNSALWDVLDSCWEPDPSLRPTIGDVILRMPLDTSETRLMAQFSKIPALSHVAEVLCWIIQDCQKLAQNRLLLELLERYTDDPDMQIIVNGVKECLVTIHTTIKCWKKQIATRIQGILKQQEVTVAIKDCHSLLSHCSAEFQLNHHLEVHESTHFHSNTGKDHHQVLDFLAAIQNAQTIEREILAAQRTDLIQLMARMQTFLGDSITLGSGLHSGLSTNLHHLQLENNELLPDFHLRFGEVERIGQFPVSGSAFLDIYEGLYLQKERVAVKVIRAANSNETSLRRFLRECKIWKAIWEVDKGTHVLPFYGFSMEGGPFPYMITPWQSNGRALNYVKNNDNTIDYIALRPQDQGGHLGN